MKNLLPFLLACLFFAPASFAQHEIDLEASADRLAAKAECMAAKAERLAARVERQAERTAVSWEIRAERFAADFARNFDRNWKATESNDGSVFWDGDLCLAFLGIHSDVISPEKAAKLGFRNRYGSYVTKVLPGTGAESAGLQPFDYIFGIDDQRTSDNQDLTDILEDHQPGDVVTLHVVRGGAEVTLTATLGMPQDFQWQKEQDNPEKPFLGISPHEDEDGDDLDGVTVEVIENSTAAAMGLLDGDIISELNGRPILDWDDVTTAIGNMQPGEIIVVKYQRDGNPATAEAPLQGRPADQGWNGENWDWNEEDWDGEGTGIMENDGDEEENWDETGGAFLGIFTESISEKKANKLGFDNPYGSYVTGIVPNSGAAKAGLMPFDYIFGVDEYRTGANQNLGGILRNFQPGSQASVHFFRKGNKKSVRVTFGSHSDSDKPKRNHCEDPFFGIVQVYTGSSSDGVPVRPVKNSTASAIGLQENDLITAINGYPILDWTDITTAIEMLKPGETIAVDYLRSGQKMQGSQKIGSYAEAKNCKNCDCGTEESTVLGMDPNVKFNLRQNQRRSQGTSRPSPNNFALKTEDLGAADAETMRSQGVNLPTQNNLRVEQFTLTANTTSGLFDLKFHLPSEGQTTVRVYNPAGRIIYDYDLGRFNGDFSDEVDLSQNGPGTYYLHVKQGNQAFVRKVVLAQK